VRLRSSDPSLLRRSWLMLSTGSIPSSPTPQSRSKRSDIHLPAGLPEMLVSKLVVVGDHFDESTINECGCKLKRCRFEERQ